MKHTLLLILAFGYATCNALAADKVSFAELFHVPPQGAPKLFGASTTKCFERALVDFNAVLSGKSPLNAHVDTNAPTVWDGGTTFYLGDGYKLTVIKKLTSIGGVHGFIYGPVLTFDPHLMVGSDWPISRTSFFSADALSKLMSRHE